MATKTPLNMALPKIFTRAMPTVFVFIWSTGFIVARYGMPHAPPLKFLSLRYVFSLACFLMWITISRVQWPKDRVAWAHLAVVGVLMQATYLGCVWSAVKAGVGAGTIALLVGLQPVLTALWLTAYPAESAAARPLANRIAPRQWLGLALGLAGLLLVVAHKLGGSELTLRSVTLAVVALLAITTGTLYQKRFVGATDVRTASAVQLIAALLITLPFTLRETEPIVVHSQFIGALAWSVLALTLGGSSLLYLMIQRGEATQVTSLMYLVPPTTAVMARLLFGEIFTFTMMCGLALTAAGVALVTKQVQKAADFG